MCFFAADQIKILGPQLLKDHEIILQNNGHDQKWFTMMIFKDIQSQNSAKHFIIKPAIYLLIEA